MLIKTGDIFGDYQVVSTLGKGGMGKVFRVRSLLTEREEAMKVVLPDMDENPELADRFLREIKVHASLDHPNIAALRTAMRVQGRIIMIMELVIGDSLDEMVKVGPLEMPTAIYYIDQVLSALEYAHSRGVVHRDIKPANILVTGPASGHPGMVKLTDFGIAQAAGAGRLTSLGMVVGSLWYMSPEQIRSEPVDARSDLYSLGLTFYQMVTGQRPIQASSDYALMNAQLTLTPPPPAEVIHGLPRGVSDVIMRAMAKRPADRFASAQEFKMALRMSLSRTTTASMEPTITLPRPPHGTNPPMMATHTPTGTPVTYPTPVPPATYPTGVPNYPTNMPPPATYSTSTPPGAYSSTMPGVGAPGTEGGTTGRKPIDAAFLDKVTQWLAPHIGPIAKVVVNRAAKSAQSGAELLQMLATELPTDLDRKKFLAAMRG